MPDETGETLTGRALALMGAQTALRALEAAGLAGGAAMVAERARGALAGEGLTWVSRPLLAAALVHLAAEMLEGTDDR